MPSRHDFELFPHVLARVAAGPFGKLTRLEFKETWRLMGSLNQVMARRETLLQKLEAALFKVIGTEPDLKRKRKLLKLKRVLHKARMPTPEQRLKLMDCLPKASRAVLSDYLAAFEEHDRLQQVGEQMQARETASAREHLRVLAEGAALREGLLLSSQSLSRALDRYVAKNGKKLSKNDLHTEKGLVKYLTRMYAKTSPFSTFTHLGMAGIKSGRQALEWPRSEAPRKVSHLRFNNQLYAYFQALICKIPDIYRRLPLRVNPSLEKREDHYLFLTNHHNVESFQRMAVNPVLELLVEIITAESVGIPLGRLVETLIADYIDAETEALEAHLLQLLGYGFLEFNIGVSGIDPDWDLKLRERLSHWAGSVDHVAHLDRVLTEVRAMAGAYERADRAERERVLTQAYERIHALCMALHEAAGLPEDERGGPWDYLEAKPDSEPEEEKSEEDDTAEEKKDEPFSHQDTTRFYFRPESIFYEDTSLENDFSLDRAGLRAVIKVVVDMFRALQPFHQVDEEIKMTKFFQQHYAADAVVGLLTFYEDYYREIKVPEAEEKRRRDKERAEGKKQDAEDPADAGKPAEKKLEPPENPREQALQTWLERFKEILEPVLDDEVIYLKQDHLPTQAPDAESLPGTTQSHGVFAQIYEQTEGDAKRLMLVLNGTTIGYGKMFSRFLHLFPAAVTQHLRDLNREVDPDALLVENCDASYFNANLHPPLMPHEVWIPNGHNSLPEDCQIPVTDLQITLSNDRLILRHAPSQKPVWMFDLGFQGLMGRSPLFQLLSSFTPTPYLHQGLLLRQINQWIGEKRKASQNEDDQIVVMPRVVLENRVILQRKTWMIPKALLPLRQTGETDWQYLQRIESWRRGLGMPCDVFIVVYPRRVQETLDPEKTRKLGRDDYKPQYLSFRNPFLVQLFPKLLVKVPEVMQVQEMLPGPDRLLRVTGKGHVTEFIVQWYGRGVGGS